MCEKNSTSNFQLTACCTSLEIITDIVWVGKISKYYLKAGKYRRGAPRKKRYFHLNFIWYVFGAATTYYCSCYSPARQIDVHDLLETSANKNDFIAVSNACYISDCVSVYIHKQIGFTWVSKCFFFFFSLQVEYHFRFDQFKAWRGTLYVLCYWNNFDIIKYIWMNENLQKKHRVTTRNCDFFILM